MKPCLLIAGLFSYLAIGVLWPDFIIVTLTGLALAIAVGVLLMFTAWIGSVGR